MTTQITVDDKKISDFCLRNHLRKLSFFGSVLEEGFKPDSDIDVLVEFDPQYPVGFRIIDMEEELSSLFGGRKVDIVNAKYLNHRMREKVLAGAEMHYAQR
ncbi:MAG: nucleotidyltransferase family protein [bacterium]